MGSSPNSSPVRAVVVPTVRTIVRPVYRGIAVFTEAYPAVGWPKVRTLVIPLKARRACSPDDAVRSEVRTATGTASFALWPTEVGVPPPETLPSDSATGVRRSPMVKVATTPSGSSGERPAIMGPMSPPSLSRRSTTTPHKSSWLRASAMELA